MNKVLLVGTALCLLSCAHVPDQSVVVQLPYAPELLKTVQSTEVVRAPAEMKVEQVQDKSPRRIYFSSLYFQYLTIAEYLHSDQKIESCPAFHHDKIETDERRVPKVALYKAKNIDLAGKNFFPELAFNGALSLADHHSNIHQELVTLCEEGVSDNYYKFDNLVTYYADKKDFHSRPGAMAAVLKIPVFANYTHPRARSQTCAAPGEVPVRSIVTFKKTGRLVTFPGWELFFTTWAKAHGLYDELKKNLNYPTVQVGTLAGAIHVIQEGAGVGVLPAQCVPVNLIEFNQSGIIASNPIYISKRIGDKLNRRAETALEMLKESKKEMV